MNRTQLRRELRRAQVNREFMDAYAAHTYAGNHGLPTKDTYLRLRKARIARNRFKEVQS